MLRITHALKNYFASKQFKNIDEKISAFDQSVKNIFLNHPPKLLVKMNHIWAGK